MSSYAADFQDETGAVRLSGTLDFTDPDNQPAGVNQPFKPAPSEEVTIVEDSAGDQAYYYDDDSNKHEFLGKVQAVDLVATGSLAAGSPVNFGSGPTDIFGAYGTAGVAQPQVPATPLPQDIVDALVALGLVSQAS